MAEAVGASVDGVDRGLDLVGPGLVSAQAPPDQHLSLGDEVTVPLGPVLFGENDEIPLCVRPCCASRIGQQHQREKPQHLGLVRHQSGQEPAEPNGLGREVGPPEIVTGTGSVSLVEDEVNHGEHSGYALGQITVVGHPVRDACIADFAFCAHKTLRHCRFRDQEGPGDFPGRQSAEQPQSECDAGLEGQRGVTADEDQA